MCHLIKKTNRKTITVYKTALEIRGNYYSPFAGTKIQVGTVKKQTYRDYQRVENHIYSSKHFTPDETSFYFYNKNMVGKSSGFALKRDARLLAKECQGVTLKIKLGVEIWEGDASRITSTIPYLDAIYAGTEILSFERI